MKAVVIERFGDIEGLIVKDVPEPAGEHNTVLVRVAASAVNPSDVKNLQGAFPDTTLPRIPGRDFAGVVLEGPKNLVGCEVWGTGGDIGFTRDGAHAELIRLPAHGVWTKPTTLSLEEAATVGVPFATAWVGLIDKARMTSHDTVVVVGANGSVGSAAVQVARWKGARVLAAIRHENHREEVAQLGADDVINIEKKSLKETVFAATNGKGASIVFDTVGGILFEQSLSALAINGRLIEITVTGERRVSFDLLDFYRRELRLYGVNTRHMTAVDGARILEGLSTGFQAGLVRPPKIAEIFPLSKAREAYELVANGKAGGKVVLVPQR